MPSLIWKKYNKLKDIINNSKINTFLSEIKVIVKEIIPENNDEKTLILNNIENIKNSNEIKIYDFIEDDKKLYFIIDNDEQVMQKFDSLIYNDNTFIQPEADIYNKEGPVNKNEIIELFKMETSMCKIYFESTENNQLKIGKGTGFFCEIDDENIPIKYGLFTNNHILNESRIEVGSFINTKIFDKKNNEYINKEFKITKERKTITNKELDYTCIELFEKDGIKDFFKIDKDALNVDKNLLKENEIFILQFLEENEISFSMGKILSVRDIKLIYNASTKEGASGSPIIRRTISNNILGIHCGSEKKDENQNKAKKYASFNAGILFDLILNDIKIQILEKNLNNPILKVNNINENINENEDVNLNSNDNKNEKVNVSPNYSPKKINIPYSEYKDVNSGLFETSLKLKNNKIINIIYYNENIENIDIIIKETCYFKKKTNGAFILCTNLESLKIISKEITKKNKEDNKMKFNLILGDFNFIQFKNFLNDYKDFNNYILNICEYPKKNENLKEIFPTINIDVCQKKEDIKQFIDLYSSEEIKPFPIEKVNTYEEYENVYNQMHSKISMFYGNLSSEICIVNYNKIKSMIEKYHNSKLDEKKREKLIESFKKFIINEENKQKIDKIIIEEYTKKYFYSFLNAKLKKLNFNEEITYFTSRFIFTLNSYAKKKNLYFSGSDIYQGRTLSYTSLLEYEKQKNKIIFFTDFKSTTKNHILAEKYSKRHAIGEIYKRDLIFSVIFIYQNIKIINGVSNGINIENKFFLNDNEERVILLPFSFYHVKDVKIDIEKLTGDIYLESIGKKEILEEQIKNRRSIKYNENENIMEVV